MDLPLQSICSKRDVMLTFLNPATTHMAVICNAMRVDTAHNEVAPLAAAMLLIGCFDSDGVSPSNNA